MDISTQVSITSTRPDEIDSLYDWLRADRKVSRNAEITIDSSQAPDSMSAGQVVDIILTHATGLAGLALAITSWRQARLRTAKITLTRSDGKTLTIDGSPEATSDIIIHFLRTNNKNTIDPLETKE